MALLVLLGGARSGKSSLAVAVAAARGAPVTFVATAEARDDEMRERVELHRAERPAGWETMEEPIELREAIASAAADSVVVVDCLSLWVANLLEAGRDRKAIEDDARAAAAAAAARGPLTIAVSNEVGLGIVPVNELARVYRDVLGRVNAIWCAAAADSALVVAGRLLPLVTPERLL